MYTTKEKPPNDTIHLPFCKQQHQAKSDSNPETYVCKQASYDFAKPTSSRFYLNIALSYVKLTFYHK